MQLYNGINKKFKSSLPTSFFIFSIIFFVNDIIIYNIIKTVLFRITLLCIYICEDLKYIILLFY